jgi:hypothetical protein
MLTKLGGFVRASMTSARCLPTASFTSVSPPTMNIRKTPHSVMSDRSWILISLKAGHTKPKWIRTGLYQAEVDKNWAANRPLLSIGYVSQPKTFVVHNGAELSVKISCPSIARLKAKGIHAPYKLPVLFVTHGGG